jgi:hypothetical protein
VKFICGKSATGNDKAWFLIALRKLQGLVGLHSLRLLEEWKALGEKSTGAR